MRTKTICAMLTAALLGAGCDERSTPSPSPPAQAKQVADEKIEASLAAAQQYLQQNELAKAEAILRTLIKRAPNEARSHEMLGQMLMQKALAAEQTSDHAAAAELRKQAYASYREAVRLQPDSAGLQQSAGSIALAAGEGDAALAHFQKAEQLDRTNVQSPLFAAQILIQQKKLDEAEAALQRVLAIDRDEPYAHASLAMIALERGNTDVALSEIKVARAVQPDDAGFRAQQAKVYRRRNEPRLGLELLVGLDDKERAQEAVAFEIAAAYDMLNEPRKAAEAWTVCWQSRPRAPRAYLAAVHAGELFLKANDKTEAARWARLAEDTAPNAPEVKQLIARIGE